MNTPPKGISAYSATGGGQQHQEHAVATTTAKSGCWRAPTRSRCGATAYANAAAALATLPAARDFEMLEGCTVSLITERRQSQPWGLAGEPGAVGENCLLRGGDEAQAEQLPDKCTVRLRAGDVLRMLTPGGGWGPRRA